MERKLTARAARPPASGTGLPWIQRHPARPFPPVQHSGACRDRRKSRAAARRSARTAHVSHSRTDYPAPAYRQLVLQFAAGESGEEPVEPAVGTGEFRLVEVYG